jgi:hypothetical protein
MAKKAPAKPASKRKPRAKKPMQPAIELSEKDLVKSVAWRSWVSSGLKAVALIAVGAVTGVWGAGGIPIGPGPVVRNDVLQQSYDADRITQAAVLRDYAAQGFKNDDAGRAAATKWFNDNRFRNRGPDFRPYTSAVTDHFAAGTLAKFADELEGKP